MLFIPNSIERFIQLLNAPKTSNSHNELNACLIVSGADHGIACENISRYKYGETLSILKFSASSHSPVSILSSSLGMNRYFFNIGCTRKDENLSISNQFYVQPGSNNIVHEDGMTPEIIKGLFANAEQFMKQIKEDNICLGEVGIGNTLATTALTALITKQDCEKVTGKGSGIGDQELNLKIELIKRCILRHQSIRQNDVNPFTLLQSLGGLEIAWNVALILQAAKNNKSIFIDGYISTVSAAIAFMIDNHIRSHLIATHLSREPGHQYLLDFIGIKPFLSLDLALGQGFGAVLGYSFVSSQKKVFGGKFGSVPQV